MDLEARSPSTSLEPGLRVESCDTIIVLKAKSNKALQTPYLKELIVLKAKSNKALQTPYLKEFKLSKSSAPTDPVAVTLLSLLPRF
jgi:hypothetical protein